MNRYDIMRQIAVREADLVRDFAEDNDMSVESAYWCWSDNFKPELFLSDCVAKNLKVMRLEVE